MMDRRDRKNLLLCAAAVLCALLLIFPVAESGVNDDWSYTKTAFDLTRTGRIVYNGWSAAMLGAQAYWGALFVKLFGFSFLAVRLSTAPLAAGCAALLYVLHRRSGLPAGLAAFGTLILTLSPVFIPNAASFMTEIPALFLFLVSLYGYVRAGDALEAGLGGCGAPTSWRARSWAWLLFGLTTGLLSGTVRQAGWFLPVMAPGVLLLRSRTWIQLRAALLPSAFSVLSGVTGAIAFAMWFRRQPCAVHERVDVALGALFAMDALPTVSRVSVALAQTLGVMVFPMLVAVPALYRSWLRAEPAAGIRLAGAAFVAASFWFVAWFCTGYTRVFPVFGNTFTPWPFLTGSASAPISSISPVVPSFLWTTMLVSASILGCGALGLGVVSAAWRRAHPDANTARSRTGLPVLLFGAFSVAYFPLLLLKSFVPYSFGLWDRYLLPVVPLATLCFLSAFHRWTGRERVPSYAWVVLGVMAFYGIAQTHDYFAQLRARVALSDALEARGIRRTGIMGGFEYDSWTELAVTGCYNDPRVERRPKLLPRRPTPLRFVTIYGLWDRITVVQPQFVIAAAPHRELTDADIPPARYSCWLPPFQRQLVVQIVDPTSKESAAPPANGREP